MALSLRGLFTSGFTYWMLAAAAATYFLMPLQDHIKFGIDLVGGTYISLLVDVDKAVEDEMYESLDRIKGEFENVHIQGPVSSKLDGDTITLTFASSEDAIDAINHLRGAEPNLKSTQKEKVVTITMPSDEQARVKRWAVESNIKVLRNRLDKFAVGEITIAAQGKNGIIVELPDVDDPEQAKAMIGKAAQLELKIVKDMAASEDDLLDKYDGEVPDGMVVVAGRARRGSQHRMYYLVPRHAEITGRYLRDSFPDINQGTGQFVVAFRFSKEGGQKFGELTGKSVGQNLACIIDGEVITAPVIRTQLYDRGQIEGDFTQEGAKELAALLKSGAYVAPVKFDEERAVGPALGAQAVRQGLISCLVGLGLLFLFSLFYYRVSGFLSFLALVYNLLVVLLILSWFRATLTLPGIAGMVLTIGMAIDASILIYERIKEEVARGLNFRDAVNAGFAGATVVILDANITTFIVGIVLFFFGTGPVQGFAVTMMIGIISTLITGMFFLKSTINFFMNLLGSKALKM